jgi:carbon-monoxide dehydrogenase large subunit
MEGPVPMIQSVIGDAPRRREDQRFVTGSGTYLDDLAFEGLAHAVILRSPHAHATIDWIDADQRRSAGGRAATHAAND